MHGREEINLRLSRLVFQKQSILTSLVNDVLKSTFYCCQQDREWRYSLVENATFQNKKWLTTDEEINRKSISEKGHLGDHSWPNHHTQENSLEITQTLCINWKYFIGKIKNFQNVTRGLISLNAINLKLFPNVKITAHKVFCKD